MPHAPPPPHASFATRRLAVIMCVDNFFSAAAAALEFAAAVQLRTLRPELARPFRIPMGTAALALVLLLPFGVSIGVMYVTAAHSTLTLALCATASLLGVVAYPIFYCGRSSSLERPSGSQAGASGTPVGEGPVHTADLTPTTSHAIDADTVPGVVPRASVPAVVSAGAAHAPPQAGPGPAGDGAAPSAPQLAVDT